MVSANARDFTIKPGTSQVIGKTWTCGLTGRLPSINYGGVKYGSLSTKMSDGAPCGPKGQTIELIYTATPGSKGKEDVFFTYSTDGQKITQSVTVQ
jgi:hypothetical protein